MAHIALPDGLPGIVGPLTQYPETGIPLNALAEAVLRGPSPLTPGERELIAAYVSSENDCYFCCQSHSAVARYHLGADAHLVEAVIKDLDSAPVSEKMRALLRIAKKVQMGGRRVTDVDVAAARAQGATDKDIHDTVLVAAAFCMFNRYVDGLATWAPDDPALYEAQGVELATVGYARQSLAA